MARAKQSKFPLKNWSITVGLLFDLLPSQTRRYSSKDCYAHQDLLIFFNRNKSNQLWPSKKSNDKAFVAVLLRTFLGLLIGLSSQDSSEPGQTGTENFCLRAVLSSGVWFLRVRAR